MRKAQNNKKSYNPLPLRLLAPWTSTKTVQPTSVCVSLCTRTHTNTPHTDRARAEKLCVLHSTLSCKATFRVIKRFIETLFNFNVKILLKNINIIKKTYKLQYEQVTVVLVIESSDQLLCSVVIQSVPWRNNIKMWKNIFYVKSVRKKGSRKQVGSIIYVYYTYIDTSLRIVH